jgi:hypothetical protein
LVSGIVEKRFGAKIKFERGKIRRRSFIDLCFLLGRQFGLELISD